MKFLFFLLFIFTTAVCFAQKIDVSDLIGEWRVCKSTAAPMVFTFLNKNDGEKGILKNWNNSHDFLYKVSFKYTISDAPKDSLTGNLAIDENLFVMTTTATTLSGHTDVQSFLVHIATQDSIGFILTHGFITPLCKVKK